MELDFHADDDAHMALYCDVLTLYLLVGSSLGPCNLKRRLGRALDSGRTERLIAERKAFESLPGKLKARILEGDPTLEAWADSQEDAGELELIPKAKPASA